LTKLEEEEFYYSGFNLYINTWQLSVQ